MKISYLKLYLTTTEVHENTPENNIIITSRILKHHSKLSNKRTSGPDII